MTEEFRYMKIHIFALRWRDEIRRSSQLRTLLKLIVVFVHSPLLPTQKDHSPMQTLCHANVQAVKSKTACLQEYLSSTYMDIFAPTETWLMEKDTAAKLEIYSLESHSFIQQDRNGRHGGGTGLLFKKAIDVKKIAAGEKLLSFQSGELVLTR